MQEGEGEGLSDNICQLWPSFTTRIKLTIKNLEGPPPPGNGYNIIIDCCYCIYM